LGFPLNYTIKFRERQGVEGSVGNKGSVK
jgi:hypothetical protein